MPVDSTGSFRLLQRFCFLVVTLTFIHIFIAVVFYVRSSDFSHAFLLVLKNQNQAKNPALVRLTEDQAKDPGLVRLTEDQAKDPGLVRLTEDQTKDSGSVRLTEEQDQPEPELKTCPETSPLLRGPQEVHLAPKVSRQQVQELNPEVRGGHWRPSDCVSLQRVAIIIPFRHRDEHLKIWLYNMHPILQRQQLDYGVYVINQDGETRFNRAKLLNVGFAEALKDYDYNCFVFSDVDIVPLDDRNIYGCSSQPRHLAVALDKFHFRLPYQQNFGGVSSLTKEQFMKINGFPNQYWGWGGEDDDIYKRCVFKGMSISRPNSQIGRCRMIRHQHDSHNAPNPRRNILIVSTRKTMMSDGINSLSYRLVLKEKLELFTKITVDVGRP